MYNYHSIIRITFSVIIIISIITIVQSALAFHDANVDGYKDQLNQPLSERKQIAPARTNWTVITATATGFHQDNGYLLAIGPEGRVRYVDDEFDNYFDVDPVPDKKASVLFVASIEGERREGKCPPTTDPKDCQYNVIIELNLTTGEQQLIHDRVTTRWWHDVDKVGNDKYLIADIANNRIYIFNTSNNFIEWSWNAHTSFSIQSGGVYPDDWTHLNDVEELDNGLIMGSLRNQDQVVFVDQKSGILRNMTLGKDDDHSILYEQHNPDFIDRDLGGPAVIVSDSENNRIVEYQLHPNETWQRTWIWRDQNLQWPRDADRLPNGNTLIVGSNDGRMVEINATGEIVWKLSAPSVPYDAERLETGDESHGGRSATELNLSSRTVSGVDDSDSTNNNGSLRDILFLPVNLLKDAIPSILLNGLLFMLPDWVGGKELILSLITIVTTIGWASIELYWRGFRLRSPVTRTN